MSTSPTSLLDGLFTGSSADELIAEEQEHQTTEVRAPSVLGKRTSPSGDVDSDNENDGEVPSPRTENPPSRSSSVARPTSGSLLVEQAIRRAAKRLKLSNENVSLVEQFAQVSVSLPVIANN